MSLHAQDKYDIIVVGSGIAGLSTALAAATLGLSVVVLEKADKIGGGTAISYGAMWVGGNPVAFARGEDDPRERVLDYVRFLGGDQVDESRLAEFVDRGPEAIAFFKDCGIPFRVIDGLVDHYFGAYPSASGPGRSLECALTDAGSDFDRIYRTPTFPIHMTLAELIASGGLGNTKGWDHETLGDRKNKRIVGMGASLIANFLKQYEKRAGSVCCNEGVEKLLVEEGQVRGVQTSKGRSLRANHVVLATGGYDADMTLAATYEGLPGWRSMFPPSVSGDGLVMASEIGGAVEIIHNNMAVFLGAEVPSDQPGEPPSFANLGITEMLCPHTMVVNGSGLRFADETYFQNVVPRLRDYLPQTHQHANLPCYFIFDQRFADSFSFAERPAGEPIPAWVKRAQTLPELADLLGVDRGNFLETAERFNANSMQGKDPDFHRGERAWSLARRESWNNDSPGSRVNPTLGEVSLAPFYGVELHPSAFCSAGLVTDARAQVLTASRRPIGGLYSVGNAAAHTEYGVGYQAGHSLASGVVFGYLAAMAAKEAIRKPDSK